ncbi:long-chain fatty acid--CoA ligase [Aeromicrobium sp. YIM 150415]|uniref:long-chain-fatty-acid--CoA ligase n=1 Tax=Aeromicrobium sp. YIM 150415 TaxID=2803912 RepID=UPI001963A4E9|nr:long-chain fatty acid--CoA ligase [Aeromicrobium sp. YIM 150415]MBM9464460.1 long-chain fatty acid--CoA ligase [Aeromicrobium sp. YIM 150415]
MSFNLATMLRESAVATPDKPLVHIGNQSLTFAQIDEASGRFAATLLARGFAPGEAVAVQLPNVPQFLIAYFGILKSGLRMVPLNPLLTAREIAYFLSDSGARALVTYESFAQAALGGAAGVDHEVGVFVVGGEVQGAEPFERLLAEEDTGDIRAMSPDDTAVILYTSGTTGQPKGAELTHFQLYMNCTVAGELFELRPDDVSMAVLPLFHVFGLSSVLNISVRFGASMVLVPRFEAAAVLDAIERHRVTIFSGVPTMYFALLQEEVAGRDLSSLRSAVSGGASIPGEVIRAFEEKFSGVVVLEGYGLSETASTTTFNVSAAERKVLSIGKPIWGVEVRILDPEGTELPPGTEHVGEIVIRGHNVMKAYFNRPEATAAALRDGWFRTGDLGYRDDEGYFFVVDRLKDLVIRGGYNVYPREVEEVLYEHPAIAEAAVVGRPDERLGEEILAFVALSPGAEATPEEIVEFCRERLAAYKYPREVRIIDSLPKGATGKILKRELDR